MLLWKKAYAHQVWLYASEFCEFSQVSTADGGMFHAVKNGRSNWRMNCLNCVRGARRKYLEMVLSPLRNRLTIRAFPLGGARMSPFSSFCSPSRTQKMYAKAIGIRRVSILFGSVTLVFSRSNALDFQSLCIGSMLNLFS